MAQYKLYYFNGRGRAEVIRWVFAAAGVKYEDFRFEREAWPEYKKQSPTGQAPFIEIHENGKVQRLAESLAITRYLAKKFGLAGKSDFETAEVEMCGDKTTDLFNELMKVHYEKDQERQKQLHQKLSNETMPQILKFLDERVAKSGSGFLAASGLTWADLYLIFVLDNLNDKKDAALENFKNVKALDQKIKAHPKIAEWLSKRPKTEF